MTMFYIVLLIFSDCFSGGGAGPAAGRVDRRDSGAGLLRQFDLPRIPRSRPVAGSVVVLVILVLSLIATVVSLRAKTWQRFSLKQKINSSSMPTLPEQELSVGDRGTTLSRLSPMGKIEVNGRTYEAKSLGAYVDPRKEIEVVGFENFSVIVKTTK